MFLLLTLAILGNFLVIWNANSSLSMGVGDLPRAFDSAIMNNRVLVSLNNASSTSKRNGALVIVLSRAANSERRSIIRDTWWQDLGTEYWDGVFLVGATNDSAIIRESQDYGDMWFGSEPDHYATPSIFRRLVMALHESRKQKYRWVIKTDDDSMLNLRFWKEWTARREPEQVYAGHILWKEPRLQDPMHRHYEAAWPADVYLPFASGAGYIISQDFIQCLVSSVNILSFRLLNNEDVMMGLMAYLCQVEPVDIPQVVPYSKEVFVRAITGEVHDRATMQCMWEGLHTDSRGGMPCQFVSCGYHTAPSCSDCLQGHGSSWCNGDCKWHWHVEQCLPLVEGIAPTERDYQIAASASAFSGPCPFSPPSTTSQHNGGWFYDLKLIETQHVGFDIGFGNALAQYIGEGSVIDLGAGVGQLGMFLKKNKYNGIEWFGFDADHDAIRPGGNNIQELKGVHAPLMGDSVYVIPNLCWIDASQPVDMEPKDWVVSIEVGEHIDKVDEDTFIENLVRLSKRGVVLSWAVEGQGGHQHINCQNNIHIIRQMESRGMSYNEEQSLKFRRSVSELPWLKKTLMVFNHGRGPPVISKVGKEPSVSCGFHTAHSCSGCPQGNGASWCNGDCKWCNARAECVHATEGDCSNELTFFGPEDYASLIEGPQESNQLLPRDECRPHVVVSSFKCPECNDLRRVIEDNTHHAFSSMSDRLAFFVPPLSSLKLNKYGVPVLGSLFEVAMRSCPDALTFTYVNGDLLPDVDFLETLEAVSSVMAETNFLMVGRRTNVDWTHRATSIREEGFDFDIHFSEGQLFTSEALDYFVCTQHAIDFNGIPPFVVGRPAYDNWLVNHIYHDGTVALIDATKTASVIHQQDSYGEYSHGGGKVRSVADYNFNKRLARGDYAAGTTNHARYETRWQGGKVEIVDRTRCVDDAEGTKKVLDLVYIDRAPRDHNIRILCYILTTSEYHETRVKAVLNTWGPKCDRLFVASNQTDESIGAVEIPNTRHDYDGLWRKHTDTLRYFIAHGMTETYDWFLKCDDDTYVVVENLRSYLMLPEIEALRKTRQLYLGRRLSLPSSQEDNKFIPKKLKNQFQFVSPEGKWTFNSGGAGYAMNPLFVQNIAAKLETELCLNGTETPEDMALAFCHVWEDGNLFDTRDLFGRERFQPVSPSDCFNLYKDESNWLFHYSPHRPKVGNDAISSESISFHSVDVPLMTRIHDYLYYCHEEQIDEAVKSAELLVQARAIHFEHGIVNLSFLNSGFIHMTLSWICNVQQAAEDVLSKTLFVTTDRESYAALKSFNPDLNIVLEPFSAPTNVAYGQVAYYEYMLFRARVVLSLIYHRVTVLVTESDAVWFRNPIPIIRSTDGDVVVNSDNGIIGSMPEMGFILLRATDATISVWKRLVIELSARLQPFKGGGTEDIGDLGSDQLLLEEIIQTAQHLHVGWLDPRKFVCGMWYNDEEFRAKHPQPWVIQNNWVVGNLGKVERAKKWNHWFVSETGNVCLPLSDTFRSHITA
ncbi:hypothetical protein ACHAXR_009004 [Thalassiosira sp. AJA248-18]